MNYKVYCQIFIIWGVSLLGGCSSTPKVVIPPLHYNESLDLHIPKVAYIYWVPGNRIAKEKEVVTSNNRDSSILGEAILAAIEHYKRKSNPSRYKYEYGKDDEVIFITSLRDILQQHQLFKQTEIVTNLDKVAANAIVLKLFFKTARVVNRNDIALSVVFTIESNNRVLYKRTYFAYSETISNDFVTKKSEVSQKLLIAIINGLKQWGGK